MIEVPRKLGAADDSQEQMTGWIQVSRWLYFWIENVNEQYPATTWYNLESPLLGLSILQNIGKGINSVQ